MFCACSHSSNIYISISTERTEDKSCYAICVQFVFSVHVLCFRYDKKGKQKHATCCETLLQNELKSDVARFTTHVQTCLATNQDVAGCENLLQKVERSSTFATHSVHFARFSGPRQQVTKLPCMAWFPRNFI